VTLASRHPCTNPTPMALLLRTIHMATTGVDLACIALGSAHPLLTSPHDDSIQSSTSVGQTPHRNRPLTVKFLTVLFTSFSSNLRTNSFDFVPFDAYGIFQTTYESDFRRRPILTRYAGHHDVYLRLLDRWQSNCSGAREQYEEARIFRVRARCGSARSAEG